MYGPCSQEEHTADSQVGEQHEEPDSWREGIEEGEVTRLPTLVQRDRRGGGEREEERWSNRDRWKQTDRKVRCVIKQGVMSQQSGNVPFAPQEGSVLHCTLIVSLQCVDSLILQSINALFHNGHC